MVTNNERREVARKLREIDTSDDPLSNIDMDVQIEEVIGVREVADPWPTYEWCLAHNQKYLNRLADLIEPEPERTCRMRDAHWDDGQCTWGCICSECGAKHEHKSGKWMNYCPSCGAKVVVE